MPYSYILNVGRYDLLNKLYQASGMWERAVAIAEVHDRIHLKSTHYAYARFLESLPEFARAIQEYEKSETHRCVCNDNSVLKVLAPRFPECCIILVKCPN